MLKILRRRLSPSPELFVLAFWPHALLSISGGLLLLGLAFFGALLLLHWGFDPTIASTPILLVIALVALFWGTAPALVTLLVSTMALDYLILDPVGTFHFPTWHVFLPLLPFLLSGVLIAILTAQREQARHLAESAQKEAERYADEAEQDTILREIVLSLTADILQEKVSLLAQETALYTVLQRLFVVSDPHKTGDVSSSETVDEQINLLQRLIADLPLLNAIRGSITLFDQSPPYDLYKIAQALIAEQRYGQNRVIDVQLLSPSVLFEQDAEQVSIIFICLLQHALSALPTTTGLSVCLGQDEATLIIQIRPANESHEPGATSPLDQSVLRNQADLWWLICQTGAKRQGGHLTFCEEEHVWTVILPRKRLPGKSSGMARGEVVSEPPSTLFVGWLEKRSCNDPGVNHHRGNKGKARSSVNSLRENLSSLRACCDG